MKRVGNAIDSVVVGKVTLNVFSVMRGMVGLTTAIVVFVSLPLAVTSVETEISVVFVLSDSCASDEKGDDETVITSSNTTRSNRGEENDDEERIFFCFVFIKK